MLSLNKLTIILNLPEFCSTLMTNGKYVMNSSYIMTLVSSSLYTLLKKKYIYFIKLLENIQMLLNCLRQHSSFIVLRVHTSKKLCSAQHTGIVSQRSKCWRCMRCFVVGKSNSSQNISRVQSHLKIQLFV